MTDSKLYRILGRTRLRLTGAYPEDCLYQAVKSGVRFSDYKKKDTLTAEVLIPNTDIKHLTEIANKQFCTVEILEIRGIAPALKAMGLRIVYIIFLCLLTLVVFHAQKHIWFLQVQGSGAVHETEILRLLEQQGVGFGTSIDNIDMEMLEHQILSEMPEVGYVTMNCEGGIATVIIRPREEKPQEAEVFIPANILAKKAGIITEITATGGTPQVKKGDVVSQGQLLISGITNLDKTVLVTKAQGEVYARTFTPKTVVMQTQRTLKCYTGEKIKRFSLTFGKNTINFYKSSGISYDNYDKMTVRNMLTLPGGYVLPIAITTTVFRAYELGSENVIEEYAEEILIRSLRFQLMTEMTAGEILKLNTSLRQEKGIYCLTAMAECREEIGIAAQIKD